VYLRHLQVTDFRSWPQADLALEPGPTVLVGQNGRGKTNLLEAVLVLARGSSFRVKDNELLQYDAPWLRLDGHTDGEDRIVKVVAEPGTKTYEIGGKTFKRLSLQHTLPTVLFEPNHLRLLHGGPERRRVYLDDLLEQTHSGYAGYRRNYRRVLSHRNALLKRSRPVAAEELFPWNLRLSELGAVMARSRAEFCEAANTQLHKLYKAISSSTTETAIDYRAQFPLASYESRLLHKLETSLELDMQRGYTAAGPHREDFEVTFDTHPAEEIASRGETRSAILALKIIELQLLEAAREQTPLLLLDDVFSELDVSRRQALTTFLKPYQTFITTTDADSIKPHIARTRSSPPTLTVRTVGRARGSSGTHWRHRWSDSMACAKCPSRRPSFASR